MDKIAFQFEYNGCLYKGASSIDSGFISELVKYYDMLEPYISAIKNFDLLYKSEENEQIYIIDRSLGKYSKILMSMNNPVFDKVRNFFICLKNAYQTEGFSDHIGSFKERNIQIPVHTKLQEQLQASDTVDAFRQKVEENFRDIQLITTDIDSLRSKSIHNEDSYKIINDLEKICLIINSLKNFIRQFCPDHSTETTVSIEDLEIQLDTIHGKEYSGLELQKKNKQRYIPIQELNEENDYTDILKLVRQETSIDAQKRSVYEQQVEHDKKDGSGSSQANGASFIPLPLIPPKAATIPPKDNKAAPSEKGQPVQSKWSIFLKIACFMFCLVLILGGIIILLV